MASANPSASLPAHLRVRALVLDVDGVMTDAGLGFNAKDESKVFNARDGQAIRWFQRAGGQVAFLSGRRSAALERRAAELDVEVLVQDAKFKLPELEKIASRLKVALADICYVGDDLVDLPCMRVVGLPVAVADAPDELLRVAACVTRRRGGEGAVREIVEWLLKSQGRWAGLMKRYVE